MNANVATYQPRETLIHSMDARVKIILVVAYSAALFAIHTWWAMGVMCCAALVGVLLAKVNLARAARVLLPLGFILVVTLAVNSFTFDTEAIRAAAQASPVLDSQVDMPPIPLVGSFGFVPAGFEQGCFYVLRIVLLVVASLVLTTTTSSNGITQALKSFLRPLERFGLPAGDIAMVASIALRFIPVTIEEFHLVRKSHTARGAAFESGSLLARVKAWGHALIPMFVGLFRRADTLALAMDARCYGMGSATQLESQVLSSSQVLAGLVGVLVCVAVGVFG